MVLSGNPSTTSDRIRAPMGFLLGVPVLHAVVMLLAAWPSGFTAWNVADTVVHGVLAGWVLVVLGLRKRPDLLRKMALAVFALMMPWLVVELVQARRTSRWERMPMVPLRLEQFPSPEVVGLRARSAYTIGERGVRAAPVWPEARADRVLCLGGSSVECLYVSDEESWPWRLGERLGRAAGRPIAVASAARSGHFTRHHEIQLRDYRHAGDFGVVLVQCGINDLGLLLRGNAVERMAEAEREALVRRPAGVPYYHHTLTWRVVAALLASRGASASTVRQDAAAIWVVERRAERARRVAAGRWMPVPDGLPAALENYRAALTRLCHLARDRGQRMVLVTQPTLYRDDLTAAEEAMLVQYTDQGALPAAELARLMAAYNGVMREVARTQGVRLVDLDARLPRDASVFYDDCHFHVEGCARVADVLAAELADLFPAKR